MTDVFAISPDPELRRTLELAFELEGLSFQSAAEASNSVSAAPVLLIDVIADKKGCWQEAGILIQKSKRAAGQKRIVLLPRGLESDEKFKFSKDFELALHRPFELFDLVKKVKEVLAEANTPRKSSSSRRKTRQRS